jgi:hypothetical protein
MSGGLGGLFGAILGGFVGFVISGFNPMGAVYGASLGFSLGMAIDPIRPDVKTPGAPDLQPMQTMSSEVGVPVKDLLGTSKITGHLLWYGGERAVAQWKETIVKGKNNNIMTFMGYKYYASWQLGICMGPVDAIYTVLKNDEVVWTGTLDRPVSGGQANVVLDGEMGTVTFYFGTDDQVANTTLGGLLVDSTLNSPLRGYCWAFFNDCCIGNYNRIPTMSFVLRKTPTFAFSALNLIDSLDYNPAHGIYYIMNILGGMSTDWLYSADFTDVAADLFDEKRGISILFDQGSMESLLETINAHIDSIIRYGNDGKFHPKLIRDDYVASSLTVVDESVLLDEPEFSRGAWINTINEVKVQYSKLHEPIYGSLVIQPPIVDSMVLNGAPDTNVGSYTYMYVWVGSPTDYRRSLIRFNFSALPDGAIITAASLGLYYYSTYGLDPVGRIYWVYELIQTGWTELGTTWNKYDGANNWVTAGGDYITTNGASIVCPLNPTGMWVSWDVLDLAKHFQSAHNKIANFLLRDSVETGTPNKGMTLYTKEYSNASLHPKLTLDYYVPGSIDALNVKKSIADPVAVDIGNKDIQGLTVSKTVQLGMFTKNENAVWAGRNYLRKLSYPLAVIKLVVNRKFFRHEIGDRFKFSYLPYSISNKIYRVIRKEEESVESEKLIITAIEEMLAISKAPTDYTIPPDRRVQVPDYYTILPFDHQKVMEAPYAMSKDEIAVLAIACRKSDYDLGFELWMSIDDGVSYSYLDTSPNMKPFGTLVGGYSADTNMIDDEHGFTVDFVDGGSQIETATWEEVYSGAENTALLGDEIISFKTITLISGVRYKIDNIIRGRFGTEKVSHVNGAEFWFVPLTTTVVSNGDIVANVTRKFKLLPFNVRDVASEGDCIAISLAITGVAHTPFTPINFMANGSSFAPRYDRDVVLTWTPRNREGGAGIGIPGEVLVVNRRDGLFKVEVWVSGILKRTMTDIDAATWTYTEAMNLTDNGSLAPSITFELLNFARHVDGTIYESAQVEVICNKN